MLNKVIIMGRLTRDPEIKKVNNDISVCSFSIACDRDIVNKQNNERETDFFDVTAWRSTADFVGKYFGKGRMIVVVGRLQKRNYTDKDGKQKTPCIIHRTSIGCYERTLALLIEKYAGAFPLWLAPVQVKLLPIADRHLDYLYEVKKQLEDKGFRCEVDDRSEKIGYKIREAQLEKVPYMVVVGDKDIENGTVSIRKRKEGDLGAMTVEQFLEKIVPDRDNKVID